MHARSEPVNLAMRGVLYDLTQFSDYKQVLERFQKGAETPYWYKDGLYAIPDTQTFYVMFYRKDILAEYGLEVPTTWEEFDLVAKLLMRNNMSVWIPNTQTTDPATNGGIGATNLFPALLQQNDVPLYMEGGKKTNLHSPEAMMVFEKWTDYYTKLKFPKTLDFYNRFRVGTTPLGISAYSLYNTLMVAAPEIEGLWSFTAIPGTVKADGTVSHAAAGGGTACSILNISKNPDKAWEFIKWWTSNDTQLSYSNNVESILGPTGRVALANIEAIKGLSWEEGALDSLLEAWEEVEEIPEYPGSYYVSRSIYQAFWNVVNANKNTKDMLMKFGKEADDEIIRKWEQYTNRR
jgi:ABC-type glycerol-3-phosphate transport system substrate-binding protein